MSKATYRLLVLLVVCVFPVSPSCSGLQNNCKLVRQPFSDVRNQVCARPTNKIVSPVPPRFISEPTNQIIVSESSDFHCDVTHSPGYDPTISWEHNGAIIPNERSSTLHTTQEGLYRCIVNSNQKEFNISSQFGRLSVPGCHGWIDKVLDPSYSNDSNVRINISKGGSAILECQANLTLPSGSAYTTTWRRGNNATGVLDENHIQLPGGSLLIRNFDPPPGEEVTYSCVVVTSVCKQLDRHFTFAVSEDPVRPVVTSNQTAVLGSNVSLYCISHSKPSSKGNLWYKDGTPLDASFQAFDWSLVGPMGEILLLSNVTMETGGLYSCVNEEGLSITSTLTILAPPTDVSIQTAGHHVNNRAMLLPAANQSSPANQTLSLTCITDSLSHDSGMNFDWFFRGYLIESTSRASKDSTRFERNGPVLNVIGEDLTGSYQCIANSLAGSVSAILFVYGKPNPPSSVTLQLERDLNVDRLKHTYNYTFKNKLSTVTFAPDTSYHMYVEVYMHRIGDQSYFKCSCTLDENISDGTGIVNFLANDFVQGDHNYMYYRVAAVTEDGSYSNFLPYYYNDSTCGRRIEIVPPPHPNLSRESSLEDNQWRVNLNWIGPSNEVYPFRLYHTEVIVTCEGMDPVYLPLPPRSGSNSTLIPCCTKCSWSVTYSVIDSTSITTSQNFTTSSIEPSRPPTINSVDRDNSDGQSIILDFTLPPKNVSCNATHFAVRYSDQETSSMSLTDSCQLLSEPASRYSCNLTLERRVCWKMMKVSVKFSNGGGGSVYSAPAVLQGVNKGDLSVFSALSITSISTSNTITISIQADSGIDCLLRNNQDASMKGCIRSSSSSCEGGWQDIYLQGSSYSHVFSGLKADFNYSIEAVLSVDSVGKVSRKVWSRTKEDVTTQAPTSASNGASTAVTDLSQKTTNAPQTDLTMEIVIPLVFVITAAAVVAIIALCCYKKKRPSFCRKRVSDAEQLDGRRHLLHSSNEQLNDDDLVSVGGPDGAAHSIHSDHTDLDPFNNYKGRGMEDYLNDCVDELSKNRTEEMEEVHRKEITLERGSIEPAVRSGLISSSRHSEASKQEPHRSHHKSRSSRSKSKSHRHSALHAKKRNKKANDTIIIVEHQTDTTIEHHQRRAAEINVSRRPDNYVADHQGASLLQPNETSYSLTTLAQRPSTIGDAQHNLSPSLSTRIQPLGPPSLLSVDNNNVTSNTFSYQFSNTSPHFLPTNSSNYTVKPQNEVLEHLPSTSRCICPASNAMETVSPHVTDSTAHVSTTPTIRTPLGNQLASVTIPKVLSLDTCHPPVPANASGYVEAKTRPDIYPDKQIPSPLPGGEQLSLSGYVPSIAAPYDTNDSQTYTTSNRYVALPESRDAVPAGGYVSLPDGVGSVPARGYVPLPDGVSSVPAGGYIPLPDGVGSVPAGGYITLPDVTLPEGCDFVPAASSTNSPFEFADNCKDVVSSPDTDSLNSSVFVSDDCPSLSDSTQLSPSVGATAKTRNQSPRMSKLSSGEFSEVFEPVSEVEDQTSVRFSPPKDNGYVTNNDFKFHGNGGRNTAMYSRSSSEGYYSARSTPLTPDDKRFVLPRPQEESQPQTKIDKFNSQELPTLSHHLPFDRKMGISSGYVGESDFFSSVDDEMTTLTSAPSQIATESKSSSQTLSLTSNTTFSSQPSLLRPTTKASYTAIASLLHSNSKSPARATVHTASLGVRGQLQLSNYQNTADIDLSTTRLHFPKETSSF